MGETDVSIIVVSWNTKKLLLNCVRTALETTKLRKLEIIVVDNGSTDGSVEALSGIRNLKVISNEENLGFAAANNMGIRASSGTYICLVNSDVEVLENCLDRMCQYMDKHPEVGLLGPRVQNRDLTLQRSCAELPSVWNTFTQALMLDKVFPRTCWFRSRFMSHFDHASTRIVEVLSGCFLMARRSALETVGLLDERFFIYKEDVDWCKRFAEAGWQVVFFPDASIIHYGGASSSAAPVEFVIEMEKANLQYWHKHYGLPGYIVAALLGVVYYILRLGAWAVLYGFRGGNDVVSKRMMVRYAACLRWLMWTRPVHGKSA
jgi:GT2 family glycosyltransferase